MKAWVVKKQENIYFDTGQIIFIQRIKESLSFFTCVHFIAWDELRHFLAFFQLCGKEEDREVVS